MAARHFLGLQAPAKLNLFLHVVGRRADGYHELQSVLVPIALCDSVDLSSRDDGRIERAGDLVGPAEGDLAVRAALALQRASGTRCGARIAVRKRIPAGSGMGGGSSDAATTLIGLNRLWNLDWPRPRLAPLALSLGADVPFFLQPGPAFAEGIGDQLTALPLEPLWAVVVHPQVHVSTAEIFTDPRLTRHTKRTTIAGFSGGALLRPVAADHNPAATGNSVVQDPGKDRTGGARVSFGVNDLQSVAVLREPVIASACSLLNEAAGASVARMTGSGAAVFALFGTAVAAAIAHAAVLEACAARGLQWQAWQVAGLQEHPLAPWLRP